MRKVIWTHTRKTWEHGRPKLQQVRAVWDDVALKVAFEEETGRSAMDDVIWTNIEVPEEFLIASARLHLAAMNPPVLTTTPEPASPVDQDVPF